MIIFPFSVFSQDVPYSQYYSNLVVLNPAFVGTVPSDRINMFYRNQWLRTGAGFHSVGVAYDKNISEYNSGVGLIVKNEISGMQILTVIDLAYSYRIKISSDLSISMGVEGGIIQKYMNTSDLIFENSEFVGSGFSKIVPDFSFGAVSFYKNIYSGISVSHIAEPYQGRGNSVNEKLNRRYVLFLGYTYYIPTGLLSEERVLSPNILFQTQGLQYNINWGFSFQYNRVLGGLWIRHNLKPDFDAMIFSLGFKTKNYKFAYSYDMNIGKKTMVMLGAHEVSFTTIFETKKKKKYKMIKCPNFLH
jgi:type IX secretion system PorP/SprF family membrane protein